MKHENDNNPKSCVNCKYRAEKSHHANCAACLKDDVPGDVFPGWKTKEAGQ